jgi:hypothetical protein
VQKSLGPYNFNLIVHQWPTGGASARRRSRCASGSARQTEASEFVTHTFPWSAWRTRSRRCGRAKW